MPVSPVGLRGALGHAERVAVAARSSGGSVRVSARGGASRASTDAEAPPRADTRRRAWVGPLLREAQAPTQPWYGLSSGVATSSSSAWRSGVGPERRAGPFASRGSAGPARRLPGRHVTLRGSAGGKDPRQGCLCHLLDCAAPWAMLNALRSRPVLREGPCVCPPAAEPHGPRRTPRPRHGRTRGVAPGSGRRFARRRSRRNRGTASRPAWQRVRPQLGVPG